MPCCAFCQLVSTLDALSRLNGMETAQIANPTKLDSGGYPVHRFFYIKVSNLRSLL